VSSSFGVTKPTFLEVDQGAPVADLLTPYATLVYVQMNRRVIVCLFHHVVSPSSVIFQGEGDFGIDTYVAFRSIFTSI
jgi:hypothetical protein